MTEIKVYGHDHFGELVPMADGYVVYFEDHLALVAAKDASITALQEQARALAAEANYLRNEIKQHSASVHFCEVCGKDDPCKTDDVCFSLNHPLPATDAVLREIRAQAVEDFTDSDFCGQEACGQACAYAARIRSGDKA